MLSWGTWFTAYYIRQLFPVKFLIISQLAFLSKNLCGFIPESSTIQQNRPDSISQVVSQDQMQCVTHEDLALHP